MSRRTMTADELASRIAALEAIGRQRTLTSPESDQLQNLLYRRQLRGYRLKSKIARAREAMSALGLEAAAYPARAQPAPATHPAAASLWHAAC